MRITAIMTHPIQYYSPWFREIHANWPQVELTVVYVMIPNARQQGVGFGKEFEWDVSPLGGYDYVTIRDAKPRDSIHSERFFGMDARGIGDVIRSTNPDVAVIPGWYSISLVRAAMYCRRAGIPTIYRGDTQLVPGRPLLKSALSKARTRMMMPLFDAFLAAGKRNEAYLRASGVDASKIFAAPHAVDNQLFAKGAQKVADAGKRRSAREDLGLADGDFALLFVGKLENKKRPWQLIEAAHTAGPDVATIIAGAGEAEARCRETASRLGVRTIFRGFVNQGRLGELYATADCLVLPSDYRETWGLVVNEAMASGLPCVVSDGVGCGPDLVVSGKTGETYPLDDVDALSRAVTTVRRLKISGTAFASNCRKHVSKYSFKAATAGLVEAATSLIGRESKTA